MMHCGMVFTSLLGRDAFQSCLILPRCLLVVSGRVCELDAPSLIPTTVLAAIRYSRTGCLKKTLKMSNLKT